MLKQILKFGLIAGLIVGIPLSILCLTLKDEPPADWGMVVGYLTMLIAFTTIFVAIKRQRDIDRGGGIGFWPALGLGLGISLVASIVYVLAWEASLAITGVDFANTFANVMIEQEKAKGVSAEALAQFTADMDQFRIQYANPLFRMPMTFAEIFPVGLLVSLISAALLRNSRFLAAKRS
ncbi:MAG: DUF4199 domain-containing protein [Dokdonella sp.]|uniref:DUF4199 domain-containing protein n=1 Tax=Dokdonella sp. TaxID=2291710 RepID=UPI003BB1272B